MWWEVASMQTWVDWLLNLPCLCLAPVTFLVTYKLVGKAGGWLWVEDCARRLQKEEPLAFFVTVKPDNPLVSSVFLSWSGLLRIHLRSKHREAFWVWTDNTALLISNKLNAAGQNWMGGLVNSGFCILFKRELSCREVGTFGKLKSLETG
jgi:hypothetical protein